MDELFAGSIDQTTHQPEFFNASDPQRCQALQSLKESGKISEVIDAFAESVEDLFKIDFPFIAPPSPEFKKTFADYKDRFYAGDTQVQGVWVYFPWRKTVVHVPSQEDFYKLRTARNKFLITAEEQDQFYHSCIGIAGLSVGSSIVNALILSGGGKHMRIADPDTLAITNLNRLQSSVCDLTRSKAIASARRAYEMNPFQEMIVYPDGFTSENSQDFFSRDGKKLDLFIEEMDNIKLKIDARFMARELGIPVIMATDNGDNTIIDVERFDLDPAYPLFHGAVDEQVLRETPANPSLAEKVKLANSIVGPDVTPRMQASLQMVGSRLPAWPQLGNAATLSGAATSYVARRILTGASMPSGRYEVNFDALIDPDYHSDSAQAERKAKKDDFTQGFDLLFGGDNE